MNRKLLFSLLACVVMPAMGQQLLTLDSCRAMALRNNKQLSVSRVKQDVAANLRKSARTKYLPHVSALGGYEWTSKEISLLNDDQKAFFVSFRNQSDYRYPGEGRGGDATSASVRLGYVGNNGYYSCLHSGGNGEGFGSYGSFL